MKKLSIWSGLKENRSNLVFLVLLFTISLLYGYPKILTNRPSSIHQWRQSDCLSITMNYYMEGRNFFEPAIHWVGDGKDGKTVSDFPIIYYSVAKLWSIFGYHEFIFRLVNLLIVFSGLFCLYKLIEGLLSDVFWATIITLSLFTSPILVYYSNNFLADAPAFGLALIGCFFFWKGYAKQEKLWYYSSFLFFLLAGLIKVSSLISFIAIFTIHIYLVFFYKKEKWWFFKWYNLMPYVITLSIVVCWLKYAVYYNQKNMSGIFLTNIYPIWDLGIPEIKRIWQCLCNDLIPAYFNKWTLYFVLLLFVGVLTFYRKVNRYLLFITVLVFLGVLTYLVLFYRAFTVHDYYLTNLLIFLPLPAITILEMVKRNYGQVFQMRSIKILAVCALAFLVYKTAVINRMKYSITDSIVKTNFVISKGYTNQWVWFHWNYENHFKAYETITPYLRQIGLKRTDRVLSLSDESINISLYLMDQKGFTAFGYGEMPFDQRMKLYKRNGVEFLIIDTSAYNKQQYLQSYVDVKKGSYKNINIYKLK